MGGPMLPQTMEEWVRHVNKKIAEFDRHRHPADTASVGDLEARVSTLETEVGQIDTALTNLAATVAANILAEHFASGVTIIPSGADGHVHSISFGKTFASTPRVMAMQHTSSASSTKPLICKAMNVTQSGCDLVAYRAGSTDSWFASYAMQWIATDIA